MDKFSQDFFVLHKISSSWIIDAKGLKTGEFTELCKNLGKYFGYNTNLCNSGHTIKTKYGGCPVCNTRLIGEIKNRQKDGYTYIAISRSKRIVKIGSTTDIDPREEALKSQKYGNASDWEIVYYIYSKKPFEFENKVQRKLLKYRAEGSYFKDGRIQECNELFSCSFTMAKDTIIETIKDYPSNYFSCQWPI
jgi:T5orf172 domain